jgi:hypothetical protein
MMGPLQIWPLGADGQRMVSSGSPNRCTPVRAARIADAHKPGDYWPQGASAGMSPQAGNRGMSNLFLDGKCRSHATE